MIAIGEVARRAGIQTSAIRYYERVGLLPQPGRESGRRRYTEEVLLRLNVIRFARGSGFTLREIRKLFAGRPYSQQLRALAKDKIAELEATIERARRVQSLLRRALACDCLTLEDCGRRLPPMTAEPASESLLRTSSRAVPDPASAPGSTGRAGSRPRSAAAPRSRLPASRPRSSAARTGRTEW